MTDFSACPTCGARARVVSGDEGTSHDEPVSVPELQIKDRVRVNLAWSEYDGSEGAVVQLVPHLLVLVDGEATPIRFEPGALARS